MLIEFLTWRGERCAFRPKDVLNYSWSERFPDKDPVPVLLVQISGEIIFELAGKEGSRLIEMLDVQKYVDHHE